MNDSGTENRIDYVKSQIEECRVRFSNPAAKNIPSEDILPFMIETLDMADTILTKYLGLFKAHMELLEDMESLKNSMRKTRQQK